MPTVYENIIFNISSAFSNVSMPPRDKWFGPAGPYHGDYDLYEVFLKRIFDGHHIEDQEIEDEIGRILPIANDGLFKFLLPIAMSSSIGTSQNKSLLPDEVVESIALHSEEIEKYNECEKAAINLWISYMKDNSRAFSKENSARLMSLCF